MCSSQNHSGTWKLRGVPVFEGVLQEGGVGGSVWLGVLILKMSHGKTGAILHTVHQCTSSQFYKSLLSCHQLWCELGSQIDQDSTLGKSNPMSQGKELAKKQPGRHLAPFKLCHSILICPFKLCHSILICPFKLCQSMLICPFKLFIAC